MSLGSTDKTLVEAEKPKYFGLKGRYEVVTKSGIVYKIANNDEVRKERASELLKALAILRGGAKQTQFLTDMSPKLLMMTGLTCGNSIFNSLFEDQSFQDTRGKSVVLNIELLNEIIKEYSDRIVTPIYIGIRTGYMKNEDKIKELERTTIDGIKFVITTPRGAADDMSKLLELGPSPTTKQPESTQAQ